LLDADAMHRSMSHLSRGPLDLTLCGGNGNGGGVDTTWNKLDTHMEGDEDENDRSQNDNGSINSLLSTPPRNRHTAKSQSSQYEEAEECHHDWLSSSSSPPPSRVMSPVSSSSVSSTWSPEPLSPLEWNDDDDLDYENDIIRESAGPSVMLDVDPPPFLPSLFSPWMCVFDLDAACGGGMNEIVEDHLPNANGNSRPTLPSPQLALPKDWNDLLPPIDLSQWFGGCRTIHENSTSDQHCASLARNNGVCSIQPTETLPPTSNFVLPPFRPLPIYPSSNVTPMQCFTNFASDNAIEAIYVPPVCWLLLLCVT
jgi:hypothetical protein